MARVARPRGLNIWMNGELVGNWECPTSGLERLTYDESWLSNELARPLSLSLPLPQASSAKGPHHTGERVANFFENLLPDNQVIRERLRDRFKSKNTAAFNLLQEIGRDCAGAIQLLPPGVLPEQPGKIEVHPLTHDKVARILRATVAAASRAEQEYLDELRISIAGAQEKTALLLIDGQWCLPTGSTPSTHIFKLPLGIVGGNQRDMRDSVENEWLCAQIMGAFGIPMPYCEIATFEDQKVLVVERFDRRWSDGALLRLPQEDCCQALGLPPSKKYESDGGPSMEAISSLLMTSSTGQRAVTTFLRAQVLFYLMAAPDGHAKNFSIRLLPGGQYELTNLYDVLSIWPLVGKGTKLVQLQKIKMAMGFKATKGTQREIGLITPRHIEAAGKACGHSALLDDALQVMDLLKERLNIVESGLPLGFPARVYESIRDGMMMMRETFVQRFTSTAAAQ